MAAQPIHLSFVWFANQYIRQDVPDLSCAGRAVAKRPFLKFDIPPVAFGDLVDVADSDVILLEPKLYGVADDVQLLRQRLVGNGCRLHGLTYEIQPLPCVSILGLLAWTGTKFRPSWQA